MANLVRLSLFLVLLSLVLALGSNAALPSESSAGLPVQSLSYPLDRWVPMRVATDTGTATNTPMRPTATFTPRHGEPTETPEETPPATETSNATAIPSQTPTGTATATASEAPSQTPTGTATATTSEAPSQTPTGTATATATKAPSQTPTGTATVTTTSTATSTPSGTPTATPGCPSLPSPPTPEPLWVDPVISPTDLLTQMLTIRLGRGRAIAVSSEAGSVTITGTFDAYTPTLLTVPLLPNITHHLLVTGTVEYAPGCFYILTTRHDRYGQPLIIVHESATPTPTGTATVFPPHTVVVGDSEFIPRVITVPVGTSVLWMNTSQPHTVTSDTGLWDSGRLAPGRWFSFTFTREGVYPYYCAYHGAPGGVGMSGRVVVIGRDYLPIVVREPVSIRMTLPPRSPVARAGFR